MPTRQASLLEQLQLAQSAALRGENLSTKVLESKSPEQLAEEERKARLSQPLTYQELQLIERYQKYIRQHDEGSLDEGMRLSDYVPDNEATRELFERAGLDPNSIGGGASFLGAGTGGAAAAASAASQGASDSAAGPTAVPSRTDPITVATMSREQLLRHLQDEKKRGRQSTLLTGPSGLNRSMPQVGRPRAAGVTRAPIIGPNPVNWKPSN